MVNRFWMVVGSGTPSFRHATKADACSEAERLAKAYEGENFFVLEAIARCRVQSLAWEETETVPDDSDDEVPF